MTYKPVKKKMTNLKNRPKFYGGKFGWNFSNLATGKTKFYGSIAQLAKDNKQLTFETWRNISKGNSNKWKNTYKITKAVAPI